MNYTPGLWKIENCPAPVYGSNGDCMATGIGIGADSTHIGTIYGKNAEANARLIAAAPELYALVARLEDALLRLPVLPDTISLLDMEQLRAAIAKAKGGQP